MPQTQICPVSPVTTDFVPVDIDSLEPGCAALLQEKKISCLGQILKLCSRKSLSIYFDTARVIHKYVPLYLGISPSREVCWNGVSELCEVHSEVGINSG